MNQDTLHYRQSQYEKTLYRKSIRNQYCYMIDRIVLFLGKDRSPVDVLRSDVKALRDYLRKEYKIMGYTSMYQYMSAGRSFYNWMDINEHVPIGFNPFRVYNTRQALRREEVALMDDE